MTADARKWCRLLIDRDAMCSVNLISGRNRMHIHQMQTVNQRRVVWMLQVIRNALILVRVQFCQLRLTQSWRNVLSMIYKRMARGNIILLAVTSCVLVVAWYLSCLLAYFFRCFSLTLEIQRSWIYLDFDKDQYWRTFQFRLIIASCTELNG